jgi:hypothetical protein
MFIQSKQAYEFSAGGEKFNIPALYIGEIPAWVEQTDLFQWGCADRSITAIVSSRDAVVDAAVASANAEQPAIAAKRAAKADADAANAPAE